MENVDFKNLHLVGDTETDGLLLEFTKVHVMAFADYKSDDEEPPVWVFTDEPILGHKYTKYIKGGLREGIEFALKAKRLCIHNGLGYDWWVFNHIAPDLWNFDNPKCKPWSNFFQDSLIQSRVQWMDRPTPKGYKGAHGLAAWGARVGVRKPEIEHWGVWNAEIFTRVVEDIRINAKTKRALDNEYLKLKKCGIDTYETYMRAKETSFWMSQQAINGWKADKELMEFHVKELDKLTNELASEVEPHLPPTIKTKGKVTGEEFAKAWNEYVEAFGHADGLKRITKYPKTKYRQQVRNGEMQTYEIKPFGKPTTKIFNIEKRNCYTPTNSVTGEEYKEGFVAMKDARAICNELNAKIGKKCKDWKPVKTVKTVKYYNSHVVNHFELESSRYTGLIDAPYTPIEFEVSRMTQVAVVKDYLKSVGWIPDDWNYKKDSDGRPVKVCRFKDNKKMITKHPKWQEMVERCGLSYVEHEGVQYIEHNWSVKKYTDLLEPCLIRTSPKLTESSYDTIEGELGQKIAKYYTLMHRRRTIENSKDDEKGWLNQIRPDGRLSAGAMVFGTSTGRMTQYGIVNVPSGAAVYGEPMRAVWICEEGTNVVSVDMNSAQLVLLCNFMGDKDFTKAVTQGKEEIEFIRQEDGRYYCKHFDEYLNPEIDKYLRYDSENDLYVVYSGTDAHTLNSIYFSLNDEQDILTCRATQDENLLHEISKGRKKAKNGIYALLFGAGDEKFAKTIKAATTQEGALTKQTYFIRLPKIKKLLDDLEADYKATKKALEEVFGKTAAISKGGFVKVAGAWLWCKSPHKLLNYLLMGSESQIQNEAINLACRRACEEGLTKLNGRKPAIGARLLLAYHDENSWECPESMTQEVKAITDWMYGQASKNLGLKSETLVTGTGKVGKSWLEVH